jgi:hypothetical protein
MLLLFEGGTIVSSNVIGTDRCFKVALSNGASNEILSTSAVFNTTSNLSSFCIPVIEKNSSQN